MPFFTIALQALGAIPVALRTVREVVEFFEQPGNGPEKKAKAKKVLKQGYDAAVRLDPDFAHAMPPEQWDTFVDETIDETVALNNAVGTFSTQHQASPGAEAGQLTPRC